MPPSRPLLAAITLVAAVATVGSLYFSLGLGLVPCTLCWYQRILMYPLVVVAGVATYESRAGVWWTVFPLSLGGTTIAAYHVYLQLAPTAGTCTVDGGCSSVQYPMLGGLLTIPRLSLVAFVLVSLLALALARVPESDARQPWS